MRDEQAPTTQDEQAEELVAPDARAVAAPDEALDELAPNGGGTSGNHGNNTAG
jgi:hypothetical protein